MPAEHDEFSRDRSGEGAPGVSERLAAQAIGRRRVLAMLGAGLFGLATRTFVPKEANAAPTPSGCFGAVGCDTCDANCNCRECPAPSTNCQNVSGRQCWSFFTRHSNGCYNKYSCCDWLRTDYKQVCICKCYRGVVCQLSAKEQKDVQGTDERDAGRRRRRSDRRRSGDRGR